MGKQLKQWQTLFWGLQNHCRWWLQSWNKKTLASWKKSYDKPRLYSLQLKMQFKLYTVSKIRPEADCGSDHELSLLLLLSCFSWVWLSATPSLGFSRQEQWSWLAISFSNAWKWKVKVKSLSHVRLSDPMTAAYQAPLSMGFSRQEYCSGVPLSLIIVKFKLKQKKVGNTTYRWGLT